MKFTSKTLQSTRPWIRYLFKRHAEKTCTSLADALAGYLAQAISYHSLIPHTGDPIVTFFRCVPGELHTVLPTKYQGWGVEIKLLGKPKSYRFSVDLVHQQDHTKTAVSIIKAAGDGHYLFSDLTLRGSIPANCPETIVKQWKLIHPNGHLGHVVGL